MLVFASYTESGKLSKVKTVKAELSETAEKTYEISLDVSNQNRLICMAINSKTCSPYMGLVELEIE